MVKWKTPRRTSSTTMLLLIIMYMIVHVHVCICIEAKAKKNPIWHMHKHNTSKSVHTFSSNPVNKETNKHIYIFHLVEYQYFVIVLQKLNSFHEIRRDLFTHGKELLLLKSVSSCFLYPAWYYRRDIMFPGCPSFRPSFHPSFLPSIRPSVRPSRFRGTTLCVSAQQKLCIFNKLPCMHCNANMTKMCTSYFVLTLTSI